MATEDRARFTFDSLGQLIGAGARRGANYVGGLTRDLIGTLATPVTASGQMVRGIAAGAAPELFNPDPVPASTPTAPATAAPPPGQSQGAVGFRLAPVQVGAPGGTIRVNQSPQDQALKQNMQAIDQTLASGVVPTPEQASQIAGLRQQAGFLRGGTDRVPVGPDGLPISSRGARYSITAPVDVAQQFVSAVAPGEYSREATAARGLQQRQFDERNAARPVMASQPQTLPPPRTIGEAFMRRGELRDIESARQGQKLANEAAGIRMNAANAAEQNRIAAESEASAAGMRQSQMGLNAALARKSDAEAAAGKYIRLKRQVPTGEKDIDGEPIMRTEEFLYDQATKQFIDPNAQVGQSATQTPTAKTIAKMKANKGNAAMEAEYKAQFGTLPY